MHTNRHKHISGAFQMSSIDCCISCPVALRRMRREKQPFDFQSSEPVSQPQESTAPIRGIYCLAWLPLTYRCIEPLLAHGQGVVCLTATGVNSFVLVYRTAATRGQCCSLAHSLARSLAIYVYPPPPSLKIKQCAKSLRYV